MAEKTPRQMARERAGIEIRDNQATGSAVDGTVRRRVVHDESLRPRPLSVEAREGAEAAAARRRDRREQALVDGVPVNGAAPPPMDGSLAGRRAAERMALKTEQLLPVGGASEGRQLTEWRGSFLDAYLREISKTPLLTVEQEREMSRVVRRAEALRELRDQVELTRLEAGAFAHGVVDRDAGPKKRKMRMAAFVGRARAAGYRVGSRQRDSNYSDYSVHLTPAEEAALAGVRLGKEEWAIAAGVANAKELDRQLESGRRAKASMVEANLRMVVAVAKEFATRGAAMATADMDMNDLVQEGTLGLVRAVEKFDSARGFRFSTYGYYWVRQAVLRASQRRSHLVPVPTGTARKLMQILRARDSGGQQAESRAAQAHGMDVEEARLLLAAMYPFASLDIGIGLAPDAPGGTASRAPAQRQGVAFVDSLGDPRSLGLGLCEGGAFEWGEGFAWESTHLAWCESDVRRAMGELLEDDLAEMVTLHYGLDGGGAVPVRQIALKKGLSPHQVNQKLKVARERLGKDAALKAHFDVLENRGAL